MSDETPAGLGPDSDPAFGGQSWVPVAPDVSVSVSVPAELSSMVLTDQPLGAVLRRVAQLAVTTVPGADDASVTLVEGGRPTTVAFCGHLGVTLDERQYAAGFGPSLDVAYGGRMVQIDTGAEVGVYPGFARQARRQGVRYVLAIGLPSLQRTRGALLLYAYADPFAPGACDAAVSFARYAAVTLSNATVYAVALGEVAQMKQAMASRAVIEQAKGIILIQERCTADEAFAILVKASSVSNRKLRDLAQEIVDRAASG